MQGLVIKKAEALDVHAYEIHQIENNAGNRIDHQDGDDEERMDWYRLGIYHREVRDAASNPICLTHIGADLAAVDAYGNYFVFDLEGNSTLGNDFISPTVTKEPKFIKMTWEDLHLQTSGYPDSALEVFTPVLLRNGKLALILNTYDEPYGVEVYDLEFGRIQNVHAVTGMHVDGIPSDLDVVQVFFRVDNERLM